MCNSYYSSNRKQIQLQCANITTTFNEVANTDFSHLAFPLDPSYSQLRPLGCTGWEGCVGRRQTAVLVPHSSSRTKKGETPSSVVYIHMTRSSNFVQSIWTNSLQWSEMFCSCTPFARKREINQFEPLLLVSILMYCASWEKLSRPALLSNFMGTVSREKSVLAKFYAGWALGPIKCQASGTPS